jgi:UPF0271 protein
MFRVPFGQVESSTHPKRVLTPPTGSSCDDDLVRIDLNADLGESAERWSSGDDVALLDVVTSANVCTGAYAGDDDLIAATCAAAAERGVAVGAQVGYPDRESFGRREMDIEPAELTAEIVRQIAHLRELAGPAIVSYVKPHGALYHRIISDPVQAHAVRDALGGLPLMGMAGTRPDGRAPDIAEGFADRGYAGPAALIPRGEPGALITDPRSAGEQAVRLMASGVDSICVHSDSPGALDIARAVRAALETAGAEVAHR